MALTPSRSTNGLHRPLADINVTPLVDVMLVLLIIFMVTAPMLAAGMKVDLPQAKQAQPLDPKEPVVVTLGKDNNLMLGNEPIVRDILIEAIRAKLSDDKTQPIHLRGDKGALYGDVVAVMDLLASHGLTRIAIVADTRIPPNEAPAQTAAKTPAEPPSPSPP
jgi:biopolymer transport protein ExbD